MLPETLPGDTAVSPDRFLAAVLAFSDEAIIGITANGAITSWNPAAERLYGYTAAEAAGQPISLIIPADLPDELPALMHHLRGGHRIDHHETVRVRKDGSRRNISVSISPIPDDSGRLLGAVSISRDITERVESARVQEDLEQQAQQELAARQASEERFWAVWEATSDALALSDPAGTVLTVNPAYCALYGRTAGEFIGQSFALIFAEGERAAAEARYRAIFADPSPPLAYEATVQRPDGTECIVDARASFLVHDGQRIAMISAIRDITERKRIEAALQASEARFRTLIQRSTDAVQLVSPEGAILYSSDSVEAVLGYQPDEILGDTVAGYIHPDDLPGVITWIGEVVAVPGAAASRRYRVRHKDGSWAWVEATITNHLETPSIGALVGNFRNVTDRVRVEAEREAFVDSAAHDLKNPLTTVLAQAQLLARRAGREQGIAPAALAKGLAAIEGAAGRMAALIEEMMDAAHLSAGRALELNLAPANVVELAQAAVEEARRGANGRRIRVEAGHVELLGLWDAVRLARVLANLLSNAVKYSPVTSEVVVRVAQDVTQDGRAWASVAVRDAGVGIPAADLPRLFERFYRGTNVAGRTHGTGIGLAGARQIVQQHGGTILVESEEGRGSTFTVRLPLGQDTPSVGDGGSARDDASQDASEPVSCPPPASGLHST
jgi:PAS domain S-box-containing protein